MIRKSGNRFSDKIMLQLKDKIMMRSLSRHDLPSCATGLRSVPTPVISTSTLSPGFIHTGGLR
jgi:hypothetical protein